MEHFKDNSGCSGKKKNQKYSGTILEKFDQYVFAGGVTIRITL